MLRFPAHCAPPPQRRRSSVQQAAKEHLLFFKVVACRAGFSATKRPLALLWSRVYVALAKVIVHKSGGEVSLVEQDKIERVILAY